MKKLIHILVIAIITITGSIIGNTLNTEKVYARSSCGDLACKPDLIKGFRCFNDGTAGYNCDDGGYPNCSETICE